jgi:hypothetical protein
MRYPFFFTAPFPERNFCFREGAGYSGIRPGLEWRGPGPLLTTGGFRLWCVGQEDGWRNGLLISFVTSRAFSASQVRSIAWRGGQAVSENPDLNPDTHGGGETDA